MALIIGFIALSTFINLDSSKGDIQLKFLAQDAQAESETIDGKVYELDYRLKTKLCVLPLFSTHLLCVESPGSMCAYDNETSCSK